VQKDLRLNLDIREMIATGAARHGAQAEGSQGTMTPRFLGSVQETILTGELRKNIPPKLSPG